MWLKWLRAIIFFNVRAVTGHFPVLFTYKETLGIETFLSIILEYHHEKSL